ncbi:MAG TPA: AEC family transporter, partial [Geminicoccaceae bacterium]|nr:AEC family transporter [Geminicoccaceae bacterium]
ESSLGTSRGGVGAVARSIARNPLIQAVAAGAVVAALGLDLPPPVTGFLQLLGPAAAAGALFALGATLQGGGLRRDLRLVGLLAEAKLVVLPALALLVLQVVPVPPDLVVPTVITTALPSAASVFVIAQRYGVLEAPVAATVFVSHLAGILTLTVLLVLLEP